MDTIDRLFKAQTELAAALDHADTIKRRRDEIILQASDEGRTQNEIAVAAGISHGRIRQVLEVQRARSVQR